MVEKFGTIKNPLTIIAVFAALSEISGTVVLPLIAQGNQAVFMWFLMLFPCLIVVLFFVTLNFNHHALYAPSDFRDEKNYLHGLQPATVAEVENKLKAEVREIAHQSSVKTEARPGETNLMALDSSLPQNVTSQAVSTSENRVNLMLSEQLVMEKMERETKFTFRRNPKLVGSSGKALLLDGAIENGSNVEGLEVKYAAHASDVNALVRRSVRRLVAFFKQDAPEVESTFSVTLAIVTPKLYDGAKEAQSLVESLVPDDVPRINLKFFGLEDLKAGL